MRRPRRLTSAAVLSCALAAGAGGVLGSECTVKGGETPEITCDHAAPPDLPVALELAHGQSFLVHVENTSPQDFIYEIRGFNPVRPAPEDPEDQKTRRVIGTLATKDVKHVHDRRYGGYCVFRTIVNACFG